MTSSFALALTLLAAGLPTDPSTAPGVDDDQTKARLDRLEAENSELRNQMDALAGEFQRFDLGEVFVPMGDSIHGLGPAASKIYSKSDGLSIGGYGEAIYTNYAGSSKSDTFDFLRGVLYFGYKFSEKWVFNSELEFEHASTSKSGSASVEFAYLDYLHCACLNFRGGLLLVPMGFLNEMHEPPTYLAATRPLTEQRIMPSTWRENGVGVFGDAGPVSYRAYLVNGLDASGFSAGGVRGGRQKGSKALAEDFALVGRVDWTDTPGVIVGGSVYLGDSGQDQAGLGDASTTIYELHGEYKARGAWLRGLVAMADLDDVGTLNAGLGLTGSDSVGSELEGAYLEAGYDVMGILCPDSNVAVSPYVRWENVDTQAEVPSGFSADPANDIDVISFGCNVQPVAGLVFKLEYQDFDDGLDRWNAAMGYAF